MMKAILPWEEHLLSNIQNEYTQQNPHYMFVNPIQEDYKYIEEVLKSPSGFDSDTFIRSTLANHLPLQKVVHGPHVILLYSANVENIPLSIWFRIIRSIAKEQPVRILYFANIQKRIPPQRGQPILPKHINGGYTTSCNYRTIVIYREEDSTRVLLHELLHASCSDPKREIPFVEADTEAWAEILYCAIKARGIKTLYRKCLDMQIKYAVNQANYVFRHHQIKTEKDYAWRYIVGRLKTWQELGLHIPHMPKLKSSIETLRLTYKDI